MWTLEGIEMRIRSTILAVVAATTLLSGSLAAAVASPAGAQEPDTTPAAGRETRRSAFLERVAALLGVEVDRLREAMKQARLDGVEDAVASGRINDAQAAKARERIENGDGGRLKERRAKHDRRAKIRAGIIDQSAAAIGITPDELKDALRGGSSIADVAAAHDVALDDVKAAILDAAREKLDAAVANGRIDQARADEMLDQLESRLDDLLAKRRGGTP
jgi:hypothetical protein